MVAKKAYFVVAAATVSVLIACIVAVRFRERYSTVVYEFASVSGGASNAVAVRDGRVVAVGRFGDMASMGRAVRTFRSLVAYPGFADCMSVGAASLALSADAIFAPEAWPKAGGGEWPAVRGKDLFSVVLSNAARDTDEPADKRGIFFAFGWHEPEHGELTRKELEAVFSTRPVVVMARSCTRFVANDAAAKMLGLGSTPSASTGVYRGAAAVDMARSLGRAIRREKFDAGASLLADHLTSVGVTSVRDAAASSSTVRWAQKAFGDAPLSVDFSFDPMPTIASVGFDRAGGKIGEELDVPPAGLVGWASPTVAMLRLDGGFVEGKQQSKSRPAASGAWTWDPAHTDAVCKLFLERGLGVRYETNGDYAMETALSQLHRRAFEGVVPKDPESIEILAVESDGALSASRAAEIDVRVTFDCGFGGDSAAPLNAFVSPGDVVGLRSAMPSGGCGPANPLALVRHASETPSSKRVNRKSALSFVTSPVARGAPADFVLLDSDPATSKAPGVKGVMFRGDFRQTKRAWAISNFENLAPGVSTGGDDRVISPGYVADAFVKAATR
jgi:hypothetical protein